MHALPGISGLSVTECRGFGRGKAQSAQGTLHHEGFGYVPYQKIEVFCAEDLVVQVVSAIEKAAHTGLRGDRKIYESTVDDAVRISTGERGQDAV